MLNLPEPLNIFVIALFVFAIASLILILLGCFLFGVLYLILRGKSKSKLIKERHL